MQSIKGEIQMTPLNVGATSMMESKIAFGSKEPIISIFPILLGSIYNQMMHEKISLVDTYYAKNDLHLFFD